MKANESQIKQKSPAEQQGAARRRKLAAMAVVAALLPFVLLECGLRVFGVGEDKVDVHAGFNSRRPLFEKDDARGIWQTNLARQQFFVSQQFPVKKPDNEFRIFCLGGSTVQGRPYLPDTSFTKWMELELNAVDPDRRYRCVNCGGVSYASYRLRPVLNEVLNEVLNYEPDLIVLATGHNEFLEDRTYSAVKDRSGVRMWVETVASSLRTVMVLRDLTGGAPRQEPVDDEPASETVEARLDEDFGYASYHRDEQWQQQVCTQYQESVEAMFAACRDAGVPVVAVCLGANLRDCPPFKSEHRADISAEDEQRWQVIFDEATAVEETDAAAALQLYRQAVKIDSLYPLLHFRIARCLDHLGNFEQAAQSYRSALQHDICPLRMVPRIEQQLLRSARAANVPVVDAKQVIAETSPQQIPGFDAYIDHVHPTIGSHQLIGEAIVKTLVSVDLVKPAQQLQAGDRRHLYQQHMNSLDTVYFSNGRRRIGWLEGWARRQRLHEETIPIDTRGFLAASERYLDLHEYDLAGDNLQMAVATDPAAAARLVGIAADLFLQGRSDSAQWILKELQRGTVSSDIRRSIDVASLVMACDARRAAAVRKIQKRHDDLVALIEADDSGWAQLMPDILARTEELTSSASPQPK